MKEVYSADSPYLWDDVTMPRMGTYLTERAKDFIFRVLPATDEGGTVLDLGCGTGKLSRPLKEKGYTAISLEYDPVPLRLFRQRDPKARLVQGDGQSLPFAAESVDAILAVELLDYFADRPSFYREAWRVLRPGGLLLATLTNRHSIKGLLYSSYLALQGRARQRRYYEMSLAECLGELAAQPFSLQNMWGYNWNLLPRDCDSALALTLCSGLERVLSLEKLPKLSPLVFVAARKDACAY